MFLHLLNVITAYRPNKFSKQLKQATKEKHDAIESHPFIASMIDGTLSDFKYAIYLNNLLPIYKAVEMCLFHGMDHDLMQSKKICNDVDAYVNYLNVNIDKPEYIFNNQWLTHFLAKDRFLQKAELYIRWLADMYGGQIIKRNIRFHSKYVFDNLRKDIQVIRTMIEDGLDDTNIHSLIEEVNKAYEYHHVLADNIHNLVDKKSCMQ